MKRNRSEMICVFFTIPLALMTLPNVTFAEENIQQSCNAYYEVELISVNGKKNILGGISAKVGNFHAQHDCDESVPNKCRRIARDSAQHCMKTHLYNQEFQFIPEECQPSNHVYNYTISDLKNDIESAACSLQPSSSPDISSIIFSVYSVTEGNKGCGPDLRKIQKKEVIKSYSITCKREKE